MAGDVGLWEAWNREAVMRTPASLSALKREASGFLRRVLAWFRGPESEPGSDDAPATLDAVVRAYREGG